MPSTKVQLIGGAFQDIEGNPVANGYMMLELSSDEQILGAIGQVAAQTKVKIELDANGNVFGTETGDTPKQYVWPTDFLTPDCYYIVNVYASNGKLVWGPQFVTITSTPSPFDVSAWVPLSPNWTNNSTLIVPTIQINGVEATSQTLLNITGTGEIVVTDDGNGTVNIYAPEIPVSLGPVVDVTAYVPGTLTTDQTLLHFNAVRTVDFPLNFTGAYATALTAATAEAVINIKKNGTTVGTITFGAASATGVFAADPAVSIVAGDVLDFVSANTDATLAGVSFTITGTRIN